MVRWQLLTWSVCILTLHPALGQDDQASDGPLVLTPLLEAGKCEEAVRKALVVPEIGGVKSYSGFFNVDKKCGNNLFFWFFPAEKDWESAPVLLWLNSFSRTTVLQEVFLDAGPFAYNRVDGFTKRKYPWTRDHNVLFLDHPVGNGFSYTEKGCYPDNLPKIYSDVYQAIVQFFNLFPNLRDNKFFIVGQNFAGKYASGIALEIDNCNDNATHKINLNGIIIGDPYLDLRCHPTTEYEYQLGIIDSKNKKIATEYDKKVNDAIDAKDYNTAYDLVNNYPAIGDNIPSFKNILYDSVLIGDFQTFVRNFKTRPQLHVAHTPFHYSSDKLMASLRPTIYEPVNACVEKLLNTGKYIVGFYAGQLDLYNPYTSIACVLEQAKWPGAADYCAANRTGWYDGGRLAGWVKVSGNLWEVAVRDSGMYTTRDQPCATYSLLRAAVADKPGDKLLSTLTYA